MKLCDNKGHRKGSIRSMLVGRSSKKGMGLEKGRDRDMSQVEKVLEGWYHRKTSTASFSLI